MQNLRLHHIYSLSGEWFYNLYTIVSFPDPALKEGKGLANLGRMLGPALRNFHTPIRSQLWHCHMTSLLQECNIAITCCISQITRTIMLTDQILALLNRQSSVHMCSHTDQSDPSFASLIGACHRTRTEDSAEVHQTLYLTRGRVWERDYVYNKGRTDHYYNQALSYVN